jgi:hypothetical protein
MTANIEITNASVDSLNPVPTDSTLLLQSEAIKAIEAMTPAIRSLMDADAVLASAVQARAEPGNATGRNARKARKAEAKAKAQCDSAVYDLAKAHAKASELVSLVPTVDPAYAAKADEAKATEQDANNAARAFSDAVKAYHDATVFKIVGMVKAKFEDEGDRNFAIGGETIGHGRWQKQNFPNANYDDYLSLVRGIRDDVRLYVAISADAIQLVQWAACYDLRKLFYLAIESAMIETASANGEPIDHAAIQAEAKDLAYGLSFFEYRSLYGKAYHLDKETLGGSIKAGWLDFMIELAKLRQHERNGLGESEIRLNSKGMLDLIKKHDASLKAEASKSATVKEKTEDSGKAIKAKAASANRAKAKITSVISDAMGKGNIDASSVMAITETLAKAANLPLPTQFGFDPANMKKADCEQFVAVMASAGKVKAMRYLAAKLLASADAIERTENARVHHIDSRTTPSSARVASELAKTGS